MSVHGLLLAAGAGSRMGRPKALVIDDEPWLARSVRVLVEGGCDGVTVVLGAAADQARTLAPDGTRVVVADDWERGMSASLAAGLGSIGPGVDAVLVHLVDLPDVGAAVVRRVLEHAAGPASLTRATYRGVPGHPVLIGRAHWADVIEGSTGDQGARAYLAEAGSHEVECADLASGSDQDRPPGGR